MTTGSRDSHPTCTRVQRFRAYGRSVAAKRARHYRADPIAHTWGLVVYDLHHATGEPGIIPLPERLELGREPQGTATLGLKAGRPAMISNRHACIRWSETDATYVVEDLGSKYGTFLNGERVHVRPLASGDVIRVGPFLLFYGEVPTSPVLEPGAPIMAGSSLPMLKLVARARQVAAEHAPVVLEGGEGSGRTTLGRYLHHRGERTGPLDLSGPGRFDPSVLVARPQRTILVRDAGRMPAHTQDRLATLLKSIPLEHQGRLFLSVGAEDELSLLLRLALRAVWGHRLRVPPLERRREDIPAIVHALLARWRMQDRQLPPTRVEALCLREPMDGVAGLSSELRGFLR